MVIRSLLRDLVCWSTAISKSIYWTSTCDVTSPLGKFFWRPTKILMSKIGAPRAYLYPNMFSRRLNAKLAKIWYILLSNRMIFRKKELKFGKNARPLLSKLRK